MMLEIHSNYSTQFNEYLLKKIKADLKKSAFFFNSVFIFHGKKYTLNQCIESLCVEKGVIKFNLYLPIKHLVYNNRQLFWVNVIKRYSDSLDKLYLLWKGKIHNRKTMSRKV